MGESGNSDRLYFLGLQNHCSWWVQPWNLLFFYFFSIKNINQIFLFKNISPSFMNLPLSLFVDCWLCPCVRYLQLKGKCIISGSFWGWSTGEWMGGGWYSDPGSLLNQAVGHGLQSPGGLSRWGSGSWQEAVVSCQVGSSMTGQLTFPGRKWREGERQRDCIGYLYSIL